MGDSLAGAIFRGWVRSASGDAAEGIPGLEQGIRDLRTTVRCWVCRITWRSRPKHYISWIVQIEASFCKAIGIVKEQKSILLVKPQKQPTRNTAAKKRTRQEGVGSEYLFGDFLRLSAFSFNVPPAKSFTVLHRVAVVGKIPSARWNRCGRQTDGPKRFVQ
jgi:hypothetical protein